MTADPTPVRIAMWSGPRNISTAMMRAWENRPDTAVRDEPLYGHYLLATGLDHPGRDAVIAAQPTDWRTVVAALTGPIPDGRAISYQKHMAHHLLPGIDRGWLDRVVNCFLIRNPGDVLASYVRTRDDPTLADLGFAQQVEIFERVGERTGRVAPILEARDVLENPRRMLTLLCEAVGVPFSDRMLSWPAGRRNSDGVWAKHWYASVERSTGFAPYRPPTEPLADPLRSLADACEPYYRRLYQCRLAP
jgi:hypothetical protein